MMPFAVSPAAVKASKYRYCSECDVRWAADVEHECFICGARGTLGPAFGYTYFANPMTINQRSYEAQDGDQ